MASTELFLIKGFPQGIPFVSKQLGLHADISVENSITVISVFASSVY